MHLWDLVKVVAWEKSQRIYLELCGSKKKRITLGGMAVLSASAFPSYGEDRANRVITNLKSVLTRNKKREREIFKAQALF